MCRRLVDSCVQCNGFGHAFDRQLAVHRESIVTRLFDAGRLKIDIRILAGIKKLVAVQVLVELLDPAVDAGRINHDLERAVFGSLVVQVQRNVEGVEADSRIGKPEMAVGERDVAVGLVQAVASGRHGRQVGRRRAGQSQGYREARGAGADFHQKLHCAGNLGYRLLEDQPSGRLFRPDCSTGGIFWYPDPTNKTSS